MTPLEKSILATIVYYDTLNLPLTQMEIFKYLIKVSPKQKLSKINLFSIITLLESKELKRFIESKNGFYFLKGRENLVKQRIKKQKITEQKWKIAKRIIWIMQLIPFLRGVMVSGSMAIGNAKKESDIDVLIITSKNRIWIVRAITTLFLHILKRRRHNHLTKDRICLNHYITEESLNIIHRSLYNAQTYAHLIPVLELEAFNLKKFYKKNKWIKNCLFFIFYEKNLAFRKSKYSFLLNFFRKSLEYILNNPLGNLLEKAIKIAQVHRVKKDKLTYTKGGRIVINDMELEFHPKSPEKIIIESYNKKMRELGFPELGNQKDSGLR